MFMSLYLLLASAFSLIICCLKELFHLWFWHTLSFYLEDAYSFSIPS